MAGEPWGTSGLQLDLLVNREDIARMVFFDTWTLNCDRHYHDPTVRKPNYDNVFLSSENVDPGRRRLIAMDHGLCFIRSGEERTSNLANIGKVKDNGVGARDGCMPFFTPIGVAAISRGFPDKVGTPPVDD